MEKLDLTTLKFDQLKAIAAANKLEVSGTAKQPYIDAIEAYGQENEIIVPFDLNPDRGTEQKAETPKLPAGSNKYQKMRLVEGEWRKERIVILTEGQASTLNTQTGNSNRKYVRIEE